MLRYIDIHLLFVIPPIIILGVVYSPVIDRRDKIKIAWLMVMATVYTTPWDNYIISQSAWSYPTRSVLFKIWNIPFEEHLFFILQPMFLILLHCLTTLGDVIPFNVETSERATATALIDDKSTASPHLIQTLPRRPLPALFWFILTALGFLFLYPSLPATLDIPQGNTFYLGMILAWICPVIGGLTWAGASGCARRGDLIAWSVGTGWLWVVDTIAIREGTWNISEEKSLNIFLWKGLPIEEAIFFALTSYLIMLSSSLISHLHILLVLAPPASTSPCPPSNPISHIALLSRLVWNPPLVDEGVIVALRDGEETLRKGSKSFDLAKLVWGREMRVGLIAVYGWCIVTDNLIDDEGDPEQRRERLEMMKSFLDEAYKSERSFNEFISSDGKDLPRSAVSAFYLFAKLIPRMIPRQPFDELWAGYATDLEFSKKDKIPIRTKEDLILYADRVAGSVAAMVCHLAWHILAEGPRPNLQRRHTLIKAREMGQALQLVNIARDIHTDAMIGRCYIPMDMLEKGDLEALLDGSDHAPVGGSYARYTLQMLEMADEMREGSEGQIEALPRGARAGTRAMVASYFEIGKLVRRRRGELGEGRLKVKNGRRIWAVLRALWGR